MTRRLRKEFVNQIPDGKFISFPSFQLYDKIAKDIIDDAVYFIYLNLQDKNMSESTGWTKGNFPTNQGKKFTFVIRKEDHQVDFVRMDIIDDSNKIYFKYPDCVVAYREFNLEKIPDEKFEAFLSMLVSHLWFEFGSVKNETLFNKRFEI